jgi:hypothetical protein
LALKPLLVCRQPHKRDLLHAVCVQFCIRWLVEEGMRRSVEHAGVNVCVTGFSYTFSVSTSVNGGVLLAALAEPMQLW